MTGAASNYSMAQFYPPGDASTAAALMVLVMPVDVGSAIRCWSAIGLIRLQLPSIAAWSSANFALQSRHRPACVRRIEVRTLIAS